MIILKLLFLSIFGYNLSAYSMPPRRAIPVVRNQQNDALRSAQAVIPVENRHSFVLESDDSSDSSDEDGSASILSGFAPEERRQDRRHNDIHLLGIEVQIYDGWPHFLEELQTIIGYDLLIGSMRACWLNLLVLRDCYIGRSSVENVLEFCTFQMLSWFSESAEAVSLGRRFPLAWMFEGRPFLTQYIGPWLQSVPLLGFIALSRSGLLGALVSAGIYIVNIFLLKRIL